MRFELKASRVCICICGALVVLALFGCGQTIQLEQLVAESSVIYLCRKEGSEFVVKQILRNRDQNRVELTIGKPVTLNMTTFGINRNWDDIYVVVFVLAGDGIKTPANVLPQSEIPVSPDGTLSGVNGTFDELIELLEKKGDLIRGPK